MSWANSDRAAACAVRPADGPAELLGRIAVELGRTRELLLGVERSCLPATREAAPDRAALQQLDLLTQTLEELEHLLRAVAGAMREEQPPDLAVPLAAVRLEALRHRLSGQRPGASPASGVVDLF